MTPTLRNSKEGTAVALVGDVYRYLATGEETGGKYALFEAFVGPGGGPPPHIHSREEETFYVLDGEISFFVEGKKIVAGTGTFARMPIGVQHAFKNESGKPVRMLISVVPAGLEKMFSEAGQTLPQGSTTAPPPTAADIAKLLAIAPRYGIEIKLPAH